MAALQFLIPRFNKVLAQPKRNGASSDRSQAGHRCPRRRPSADHGRSRCCLRPVAWLHRYWHTGTATASGAYATVNDIFLVTCPDCLHIFIRDHRLLRVQALEPAELVADDTLSDERFHDECAMRAMAAMISRSTPITLVKYPYGTTDEELHFLKNARGAFILERAAVPTITFEIAYGANYDKIPESANTYADAMFVERRRRRGRLGGGIDGVSRVHRLGRGLPARVRPAPPLEDPAQPIVGLRTNIPSAVRPALPRAAAL